MPDPKTIVLDMQDDGRTTYETVVQEISAEDLALFDLAQSPLLLSSKVPSFDDKIPEVDE